VAKAELTRRGELPLAGEDADQDDDLALFREVGHAQWRSGATLSGLLAAYQAGARAAWRRMSRTAVEAGLPVADVAALAEAVFVLVDDLSRTSALGYVEEQSTNSAERERARAELGELLLTEGVSAMAVAAVAERACWSVPATATVVLLTPDNPVTIDLLTRTAEETLVVRRPEWVCLVVPEPERYPRERLQGALRGAGAVVGPSVPLHRLSASLRVTSIAAGLQRSGVFAEDPLFADEHLDAVIVHRDARLLDALRERALAPLAELPVETRQRLEDTLRSWLRHMGDRQAVAAELFIHRQTVRYRMAQLQVLFDGALDDPDVRSKLTLALAFHAPAGNRADDGVRAVGAPE
jgi:hypothetical protein